MFRSLATRLVAWYVFVAIALVAMVGTAVTIFALWSFRVSTDENANYVLREAPDLVKTFTARHRKLEDASGEIVRRLSRPGLRVALLSTEGGRHPLAIDDPLGPEPGGHVIVMRTVFSQHISRTGKSSANVPPPPPVEIEHSDRTSEERIVKLTEPPMHGGADPFAMAHMHGGFGPGGGGGFGMEHGPMLGLWLTQLLRLEPRSAPVPGGEIVVFVDPRPLAHTIGAFWIAMLPIGLLSILIAWLLGRYITNQALRPLVETTAALRAFAGGDFTPRAIVTSDRNEIGELVTAYNGAVAQVAAGFEERRVAEGEMRRFIADAGHELRTPLTVVMGFIDVLRRRGSGETFERGGATTGRILETMLIESRRMRALIDKLIALARLDNPEIRLNDVDVNDVVEGVVRALEAVDPQHRIALHRRPGMRARVDESGLHEAITNVIENALKYAASGPIDVGIDGDANEVRVSVRDQGPGVPAEEREHVFERFYRGAQRGESEGFGLGLSIARRAVKRSGGEITLGSEPGAGACFTIRLSRIAGSDVSALAG